jgi:hypothetical protein
MKENISVEAACCTHSLPLYILAAWTNLFAAWLSAPEESFCDALPGLIMRLWLAT